MAALTGNPTGTMRVAMIGAGSYARTHLDVLIKEKGVTIVGHVSPTPASRSAAAQRYGGRAYASCAELLENEQVDAAWVCVPPFAHGAIETCLIERCIPFFVEKPLAADRGTAENIGRLLVEQEIVVGVGYKFRALSALTEVRAQLEQTPARLVIAAWHSGTPETRWWQRQDASGGQLVEQATHMVDLARHLQGDAHVVHATASYEKRASYPDLDVATTSTGLLEFTNGATGFISATCLLNSVREVYLNLVCEGLVITITPDLVEFKGSKKQGELRATDDLVAIEDRAFLRAVRNRDESLLYCSYADALLTHRLCFDMLDASQLL